MNNESENTNRPHRGPGSGSGGHFRWSRAAVVLVATVVAAVWWHSSRATPGTPVSSGAGSRPTVAVVPVERQDLFQTVTIPAEFRPYVEVELHAKVSGYLQQISVDFGDKVKAGQALATLEVPELHDELNNAIAAEQRADADYTNAHLVCTRLQAVNKDHPNLVAQQDLDTAVAKDGSTAAEIAAAKADVERYQTLVAYTKITAPFSGIITRRYADPGALIQAGTASDTQAMPLVRLSDNYHLRLDFPVSVDYVQDVRVGDTVEVRVDSLGAKTFSGTITRFSAKVDENTRTMMTEILVDNPNLEVVPGMYASVMFKVQKRPRALAIPIEAVAVGGKSAVLIVNAQNQIEERSVKLGLETASRYEVLSGLQEGDRVVIGNPAQAKVGQTVDAKTVTFLAQQ